jgi:hypothetical protein
MPFTVTNRGKYYIANNAITSSTDIRVRVFKGSAPTAGAIQDYNFIADLIAFPMVEAAATGYAARQLTSVALTEDDAGNLAKITAAAPLWTSVATGETWTTLAYYIETAVSPTDANRTLLGVDVPSTTVVTNGQNVNGPALEIDLT